MKKLFYCMLFISGITFANSKVVNVYNWSGYIPNKVLMQFKKETGIRVNYSTFESNQILYTKLRASPNAGYDVVVPSSYIVQRMIREHMLRKLDHAKLPNFRYLNPVLLNRVYDPKNRYSVPYLWGTTGIILNRHIYPKGSVTAWRDLWQKRFRRQISLSDSMRDMFAVALKMLGYSINDRNPKHIVQAYLKLKTLLPNALAFESGGSQQMFVNEDANAGIIDSGDAHVIMQENKNYYYVYPKEGALVWVDSMIIPKGSRHVENAYRFINFILRPDIAKQISEEIGYATPNLAGMKLMSTVDRHNPIINPSKANLKNTETEGDIGIHAERFCLKYWEELKLGS